MKVQQTMMMKPKGKSVIATSAVGQMKKSKKSNTSKKKVAKKSIKPMPKKAMKKKIK
jgi:hypothetical protein